MESHGIIFNLSNLHPLHGDEDNYRVTSRQVRYKPYYELGGDGKTLEINDPVWDRAEIGSNYGDQLIIELYNHPLIQRLRDVEQLTLPLRYSTMPGSTDLTRWEHAWGSLVFARKLIDKAEADGQQFTDREKLILQLRTFLSDVGHTAFSHLGDWILQGFGGSEDQHDQALKNLLEVGGVAELLNKFGVDLSEVVGTETDDWVEMPSPDLCVDRVDYGVREINRWIQYPFRYLNKPMDHFSLVDGQIVMSSHESAKFFGIGFGLLATEHWSQPIHRLQLQLFAPLVKSVIMENGSPVLDRYDIKHPADFLYTTDSDIHESMRQVGDLNNDLHAIILNLARDQRRVFAWGREFDVESFVLDTMRGEKDPLRSERPDFLQPLEPRTWQGEYSGVKPPNIELVAVKTPDEVSGFSKNPSTLDVFMPSLKPRAIDPLFLNANGQISRLSQVDEYFAQLLRQHKEIQAQAYVARVHLAPDFADQLKGKIAKVERDWEGRFSLPRAKPEMLRRAIGEIAWHATLGL